MVQQKIESLVINFIDCLGAHQAYKLEVPRNAAVLNDSRPLIRDFSNPTSSRKYCQIMSIAALISELDATSRHIAQRDVYYALKFLFKNQAGICVCLLFNEIPLILT